MIRAGVGVAAYGHLWTDGADVGARGLSDAPLEREGTQLSAACAAWPRM
jgi:hypothetical protein